MSGSEVFRTDSKSESAIPAPAPAGESISIAAVERDTGLSKDTLRVWERRYGFPKPARDDLGERLYGRDDVAKLRVVKRLLDLGHRPGRIMALRLDELQQLAVEAAAGRPSRRASRELMREAAEVKPDSVSEDLQSYLDLVKAHRVEQLRGQLSQAAMRLGLASFVDALVAPLNQMVGNAWTRGELEIFEEHLYTEAVQVVLRNAIGAIPQPRRPPSVLLTTFPNEPHGLGLLMAESIFALEGCRCVSLGVQTPVWDIALAASRREIDIVALSFTATLPANSVLDGLAELQAKLPQGVEIWAGGRCPALQRRRPAQIRTFASLGEIAPGVVQWRAAHGASP